MSMLHIAMFEAVNAIERRYAPYKLTLSADRSTSKDAAAATAAHDVLLSIYPDQKAALDAALAASLSGIPETEAKVKGIALGKEAAEGVIALRAKDGADAQESYRPQTKAGPRLRNLWSFNSLGYDIRLAIPPRSASCTRFRDVDQRRQ
jgi:hypothetical protein